MGRSWAAACLAILDVRAEGVVERVVGDVVRAGGGEQLGELALVDRHARREHLRVLGLDALWQLTGYNLAWRGWQGKG